MISAGDFRNGKTLEIEGTVYQILEFQHVKPGKGGICSYKVKGYQEWWSNREIFPSNREVPGGKN